MGHPGAQGTKGGTGKPGTTGLKGHPGVAGHTGEVVSYSGRDTGGAGGALAPPLFEEGGQCPPTFFKD